jgi:hypothetical protein
MSIDIRLPKITATSEAGKLEQLQSYLHQLVEQLNWALANVQTQPVEEEIKRVIQREGKQQEASPQVTFNSIKSLIIKSADIVNAYEEKINKELEGKYVAVSDFGIYKEDTLQKIEETSTSITQFYEDVQEIITNIENVEHTLIDVSAHIKSGLLYYDDSGAPVYGLEIGQRNEVDGEEVFNKYARFTPDKLSFYDQNDNEVAYISDKKLYITDVELMGSFRIGGFIDIALSDGGVVTKWVGQE